MTKPKELSKAQLLGRFLTQLATVTFVIVTATIGTAILGTWIHEGIHVGDANPAEFMCVAYTPNGAAMLANISHSEDNMIAGITLGHDFKQDTEFKAYLVEIIFMMFGLVSIYLYAYHMAHKN